jgi:hypothetical protein
VNFHVDNLGLGHDFYKATLVKYPATVLVIVPVKSCTPVIEQAYSLAVIYAMNSILFLGTQAMLLQIYVPSVARCKQSIWLS